ncbi:MAG: DUF11 domain-containing protein [Candidatus Kuenenia sp.]|nr:DUF11 domain-containing protein [Candidatus Kuenenia hertensis]
MNEHKRRFFMLSILFLSLSFFYGCSYTRSYFSYDEDVTSSGRYNESQKESEKIYSEKEKIESDSSGEYKRLRMADKQHGLVLIDKNLPSEPQVGQIFDYVIMVTNVSDQKLMDVKIIETLSNNFEMKNSIPKISDAVGRNVVQWNIGDLSPDENKSIRVFGIPAKEGTMSFCTDVNYRLPPFCAITNVVQPKLLLTKNAPSTVLICDVIPMTFVVQNSGTGYAKNVQIKESLPEGLATQDGHSSVILKVGTLAPGETRTLSLNVTADKTGEYNNIATVAADGGLSAESNKTTTVVQKPELKIVKKGPGKIYLGRDITYDMSVSNVGNGPAGSTVVEDTIPANTSFLSASYGGVLSAGSVVWNLGTLYPKDTKELRITLRPDGLGSVLNRATAKSVCADAVSATAVTEVLGIAAILLEVIDVEDPVEVGNNTTYVITVTNQGSDHSENVTISCMLEDTMEYVSSSGATGGLLAGEGKIVRFDPLPSLAPKAQATWKVVINALREGDVRFKVSMKDDRLDRPVEETEATNFYK